MARSLLEKVKTEKLVLPDEYCTTIGRAHQHLSYDGAGHWIPCAYLPTAGSKHGMIGGTPEGTAAAQADSWPRVLLFLVQASEEKGSRP